MKDFVCDILTSQKAKERRYFDYASALKSFSSTGVFDRTLWGFLALELWQRQFIDKQSKILTIIGVKPYIVGTKPYIIKRKTIHYKA